MAVDPWGFDRERQAIARRLRTKRLRLSAVRGVAFAIAISVLVFGGSGFLRNSVLGLAWPVWASTILFLTVLFALFAAVELPFGYIEGYRWEKACGLSAQTFAAWLKDVGKSLGLGLAASVVAGGVLLWLLATWPASWWAIAWAISLAVSAVLGFVAPVLLVPLFYRFRPVRDASLRSRFESLAAKADVPIVGVFELRASE
ncbi:MAG: hypothetical protein ACREDF_05160, partial [Thermoplasmata archaeon]